MFEAQPLLVTELVGGVDFTAHHNICENFQLVLATFTNIVSVKLTLNTDTELAILVVSGLWFNLSVLCRP